MRKKKLKAEVELSLKEIDECMCDECDILWTLAERVAGAFIDVTRSKFDYLETVKLVEILDRLHACGMSDTAVETLRTVFTDAEYTEAEKEFELYDLCLDKEPEAAEIFMRWFFENEDIDDISLDILFKKLYAEQAAETAEKLMLN